MVTGCEAVGVSFCFVLVDTTCQIVGNASIEDLFETCHQVDVVLFHGLNVVSFVIPKACAEVGRSIGRSIRSEESLAWEKEDSSLQRFCYLETNSHVIPNEVLGMRNLSVYSTRKIPRRTSE
jgi:hypothetical protein